MVLKKKEIIAASLVVLIGVAGYLNWSYQDTIRVQDGESYIETGKKLGEAQYVNSVDEVEDTTEGESEETASENTEENNADEAKETGTENADDNKAEESRETISGEENYFEQARLNRETSRSKSLEILNQTAENTSFDEDIRKKAGDKILDVANNVQKEAEIEDIAASKGYNEICVYVDDSDVNVMVRKEDFGNDDVIRLTAIVTEQLKISAQNVKIVEVK